MKTTRPLLFAPILLQLRSKSFACTVSDNGFPWIEVADKSSISNPGLLLALPKLLDAELKSHATSKLRRNLLNVALGHAHKNVCQPLNKRSQRVFVPLESIQEE
jgi:hypothetical protein